MQAIKGGVVVTLSAEEEAQILAEQAAAQAQAAERAAAAVVLAAKVAANRAEFDTLLALPVNKAALTETPDQAAARIGALPTIPPAVKEVLVQLTQIVNLLLKERNL